MGMGVYGKKANSEVGKYFRNSCWGWRPLWDYCAKVAPDIISNKLHDQGHYNDGDGLNEKDSKALAERLRGLLASGEVAKYTNERLDALNALPDEPCEICGATGKRAEPPACGPGPMPCNGCNATGKRHPSACMYPFSVANVTNFAAFLEDCGGFEIC
jgi:hypothetical protein